MAVPLVPVQETGIFKGLTLDKLPGDPKQRTWLEKPARIVQTQIIAEQPPDNTVIWFLTVTDERDTTVSSELVFPGT
jgi:hypothetical protein